MDRLFDLGTFTKTSAPGALSGVIYGLMLAFVSALAFTGAVYGLYAVAGESLAYYLPVLTGVLIFWAFVAHVVLTKATFRRWTLIKGYTSVEDFWVPSLLVFSAVFLPLFLSAIAFIPTWLG